MPDVRPARRVSGVVLKADFATTRCSSGSMGSRGGQLTMRMHFPGDGGLGYVSEDVETELCRYYTVFTDGLQYDEIVYSVENRGRSDTLLEINWKGLCELKGRGRRLATKPKLIGTELVALADVPDDASLFGGDQFDDTLATLVGELAEYDGISLANATKLLHQKRPGLVPILDSFAREAMGIENATDPSSIRHALHRVRLTAEDSRNSAALDVACSWVHAGNTPVGDRPVTRLRVLDILAWTTIQRHR